MRKLSKKIYNDNIGDRHAVKALALFVFVKDNKPTSVFTDYTITALAKFANLSRNTTRKRIKKLEEMGLVERVGKNGQHLLFKRARVKCEYYGLLSPQYRGGYRGGCFFCFFAEIDRYINIRKNYPHYWQALKDLYYETKSQSFKYSKTLEQVEREMDIKEWEEQQPTLFDFI